MSPQPISDETYEEIVAGLFIRQKKRLIAEKTGVSVGTVRNVACREGVAPPQVLVPRHTFIEYAEGQPQLHPPADFNSLCLPGEEFRIERQNGQSVRASIGRGRVVALTLNTFEF